MNRIEDIFLYIVYRKFVKFRCVFFVVFLLWTGVLRGVGGEDLLPQMIFQGDELQGKKAPGEQVRHHHAYMYICTWVVELFFILFFL